MKHSDKNNVWNKCDHCGQFISYDDFANGKALRVMTIPESPISKETYKTLCKKHNEKN